MRAEQLESAENPGTCCLAGAKHTCRQAIAAGREEVDVCAVSKSPSSAERSICASQAQLSAVSSGYCRFRGD